MLFVPLKFDPHYATVYFSLNLTLDLSHLFTLRPRISLIFETQKTLTFFSSSVLDFQKMEACERRILKYF